ncbi:hypothetical protein COOONC_13124 [Cooperia oncophora]
MVDVFQEVLGNMLYTSPPNSAKVPLPSPNALKNKILLRGKKLGGGPHDDKDDDDEEELPSKKKAPVIPLDPAFSDLISLRAVKLSHNIHADVKTHPMDGTPSLSENKIAAVFEGGSPIFSYTAQRFTKTYPKVRVDL